MLSEFMALLVPICSDLWVETLGLAEAEFLHDVIVLPKAFQ